MQGFLNFTFYLFILAFIKKCSNLRGLQTIRGVWQCQTKACILGSPHVGNLEMIFPKIQDKMARWLQFKLCVFCKKSAESKKNAGLARGRDKSWHLGYGLPIASITRENWYPVLWSLASRGYFTNQVFGNWKRVFSWNTRKSLVGKVVGSIKMHACAEFGDDCTSFDVALSLTELAWVESHATSYMIACFVRDSHFSLSYVVSSDRTWN